MFAFMVMLFVRPASALCGTGTTCRTTSGSGSYCEDYSGDGIGGVVWCHAEGAGANTIDVDEHGVDWDVTVADSGGSICCDTTDYPWFGLALARFIFSCDGGPSSCIVDLTMLDGSSEGWLSDGDDEFYGSRQQDTVRAGDGDDILYGWESSDHLAGEGGSDFIDGGPGQDDVCAGTIGPVKHCDTPTNTDGCNNILLGGAGDDALVGSSETGFGCAGDYMDGGFGEDDLHGAAGADTLCGGSGVDDLDGGPGNDYLYGGRGAPDRDIQDGGTGNDRCEDDPSPLGCESPSTSYPYTTSCPAVPAWP